MDKSTNYSMSCPSVSDFEKLLQGLANESLQLDFFKHLDECELCNVAFEGYKANHITEIKEVLQIERLDTQKRNPLRLLAYAATITVLVGGYFFFQNSADNQQVIDPLFASDTFTEHNEQISGSKKLLAKNQEDYWHINDQGELSLNDQVIRVDQIDAVNLEQGRKAFVGMSSTDNDMIKPLVRKLKEDKKQKVFTVSKKRNLNPITSSGVSS